MSDEGDGWNGDNRRRWHLSREIPVPTLLALAAYAAVGIWWAATLDGRVTSTERQAAQNAADLRDMRGVPSRLGSIEEALRDIQRLLWRLSQGERRPDNG